MSGPLHRTIAAPALLAVAALTLALGGCGVLGGGEEDVASPTTEETTAEETTTEDATTEEDTPSDEATTDDATTEEDSTTEETSSDAPSAGATEIRKVWPDDSWDVQDVGEDLCGTMTPSASPWTLDDDLFLCGPTAAGLHACALEEGDSVLCVVDATSRTGARFDSPVAAGSDPSEWEPAENPLPLYVELEGGATCAVISHDHDDHYEDMFSWYACDDGSELLTDEDIANTFEQGEAWTAQCSVDKGAPETVAVRVAAFAGR